MRALVAGASGAIGRPLVAALHAHGHAVVGLTRDPKNADLLARLGAQPLFGDVLDRDIAEREGFRVRARSRPIRWRFASGGHRYTVTSTVTVLRFAPSVVVPERRPSSRL